MTFHTWQEVNLFYPKRTAGGTNLGIQLHVYLEGVMSNQIVRDVKKESCHLHKKRSRIPPGIRNNGELGSWSS